MLCSASQVIQSERTHHRLLCVYMYEIFGDYKTS